MVKRNLLFLALPALLFLSSYQHCRALERLRGIVRQNIFPSCPSFCDLYYLEPDSSYRKTFLRAAPLTDVNLSSNVGAHVEVTGGRATCEQCDVFGVTQIERLTTTDVEETEKPNLPGSVSLSQNYPNPFNPTTTLSFVIGYSSLVTVRVYDLLGREIATIVNQELSPGEYTRTWDAGNVSGGVYFYRLDVTPVPGAVPITSVRKMVVLK